MAIGQTRKGRAKKKWGSAKAARRRARKLRVGIQVRRKKEFTYRGHTMKQLQKMSLEEFMGLLSARQRRCFGRGLVEDETKGKVIADVRRFPEKVVRTHLRDMVVIPEFVGRTFAIYDGREYRQFTAMPEMIGHYFGEFASTRTPPKHTGVGVGATRSSKFMPLK